MGKTLFQETVLNGCFILQLTRNDIDSCKPVLRNLKTASWNDSAKVSNTFRCQWKYLVNSKHPQMEEIDTAADLVLREGTARSLWPKQDSAPPIWPQRFFDGLFHLLAR